MTGSGGGARLIAVAPPGLDTLAGVDAVQQGSGDTGVQTELYDLRVVVERIEGRGVCGMEIGDEFTLTRSSQLRIPTGRHFCIYALAAVLPLLAAKQRALAPGDWLERDAHVACPDPDERLIMRIERIGVSRLDVGELT